MRSLEAVGPILDAALDAVVIIDQGGTIRAWNKRAHETFGWSPDEASGRPMSELIVPARLRPSHHLGMTAYLATGKARVIGRRVEVDARHRSGHEFPVELTITEAKLDGERLFVAYVRDISDRRKVADEARISRARFEAAVRAVEGVIWTNDAEGRMTGDQPGWSALTGQSRREYEGYGWSNAVHPDDAEPTVRAWQEAVTEKKPFVFEHRLRRRDGTWGVFAIRAIPTFDEGGALSEWVGVHTDITSARQTEAALRELNANLEQRVGEALAERKILAELVERTDAFVQVVDCQFRWLAINAAAAQEFERIFGVEPQVGQSMIEVLADQPEHQEAVRRVWARALSGEEFTETGEFGDPGRDRRSYEMKYNALRDADGRQVGAYQFVYDVTHRVEEQRRILEAEAGRRRADALYRAYFENTPEALFIVGVTPEQDFVVEEINPAHEAGVGLKLADIQGKHIADILPEPAAARVLETYRHVLTTGQIYQYREVYDLGGQKRHWDTSLVPMRDDEGRVIRLIGASRDVTPQVQAEEALRQSQKMEAMGQLTGGVAHDFNNLLTPIVASLDMLQRRGLGGAREQRLIDGAVQSAERAKVLVQRLLSFARRQPLQATAVDVGKLAEGMADLLASTTGPQISLVVQVAPDLPPAQADANQVEMALLNLGVNARDAMPHGGVLRISAAVDEIELEHRSRLPCGRYIRLTVADTGTGMDEHTLTRAVEPFFSTKGVGRGTGLGLSMVHGLASQLGGALSIQSQLGVGTSIDLWLPIGAGQDAETPVPHNIGVPASVGTALLVDDEELVRASTADMLCELGFEVVETNSAESALQLLAAGLRPVLLVTDHLMPGLSGADLVRRVRDTHPAVRALVVSGYAEVEGLAPDLPRLTKPFNLAELATAVASL